MNATTVCDRYRSGLRGVITDAWHGLARPITVVAVGVIGIGVGVVLTSDMSGMNKALLLALPVLGAFVILVVGVRLGYQPVVHFRTAVDPGRTPMFDIQSLHDHARSLNVIRLELITPHGARYLVPWRFDYIEAGRAQGFVYPRDFSDRALDPVTGRYRYVWRGQKADSGRWVVLGRGSYDHRAQ